MNCGRGSETARRRALIRRRDIMRLSERRMELIYRAKSRGVLAQAGPTAMRLGPGRRCQKAGTVAGIRRPPPGTSRGAEGKGCGCP